MKSKHKIANSNDESLEERLEIMNNRITSLTNELKLKTIEFKECDVKYSKLEKNNQKLREMIKSMEKQKQGNKSIQCFSRRSDISTQTDDHNANAYAKLLVKTNLLEKNLEENKEKLEKQINENTKIKSTQAKQTVLLWGDDASQKNHTVDGSIDSKLQQFTTDILDSVTKIVDEKLNLLGNHFQTLVKIPEEINPNCKTFKDTLLTNKIPPSSAVMDLKIVLNRNRNDQLVQEAERKRRAQNLIIHGVQEVDAEKQKVNDENFITLFLREIGVETTPESIVRLGKAENNKTRPLKIKLKSEAEKDTIMSRLPNLKNAEDVFRRISVTDDHTIEERQEIERLVKSKRN